MGLTIIEDANEPMFKLPRRLWLARDEDGELTRVVEDGDPAAASLLGSAGKPIPVALAERLGLTGPDPGLDAPETPAPPAEPPSGPDGVQDPPAASEQDEEDEVPPYEAWSVPELRAECQERGLNHLGVKTQLVARLTEDDEANDDEEGDDSDG